MENFSIPFGKPHFNTDILKRKQEVSGSGLINTGVFVDVDNVDKYRQKIHTERRKNQRFYVDNVDKLFSKEGFADFYDISGSHGYQQISVHTIF